MQTRRAVPADAAHGRIPADTITRLFISLLIALLLWGWVTTQRNPPLARTIAEVPISVPQLPGDLQIGGELGNVTIEIEGPRSIVEGVVRADLEPTLDVSAVSGPNEYTVPVVVNLPPAVRVERIDPAQLSIVVDEQIGRTVPLDVVPEAPVDGSRQFGEITPDVSEVTVDGPRRLVDQVARVVLPVEMGDRTDDFTAQITPIALDADNQPIPEVSLRPRRVLTTVEVNASGRAVPVLIQTVGSPAPGYELGDGAVDPETVLLDGPEESLASIVSVQTEPISVDGARGTVSRQVGLTGLPPEVSLVDPTDGTVGVVIQVRQRGVTQTLPEQPVVVSGAGAGLEATVEPAAVSVVVDAAEDDLATLRTGDVIPRASVAGLGAGLHQVPLTVEVPAGVEWIRAEPATVQVMLRPAGLPTREAATPERERREMP
jgi:YbbR domain-containing protein